MVSRHITRFFAPPESRAGDVIVLPDSEAKHATQVLRMQVGDVLEIVDGAGTMYSCRLEQISRRLSTARIEVEQQDVGESDFRLWMGIPILKQASRLEYLIEKCAELGAYAFLPFTSEHTEGRSVKVERLRRIAIAAMKQSGRSRLPEIDAVTTYEDLLSRWSIRSDAAKLILHEATSYDNRMSLLGDRIKDLDDVLIVIGPEGGFSEQEVDLATTERFAAVSLGKRRLRSETACVVAAGILSEIRS